MFQDNDHKEANKLKRRINENNEKFSKELERKYKQKWIEMKNTIAEVFKNTEDGMKKYISWYIQGQIRKVTGRAVKISQA